MASEPGIADCHIHAFSFHSQNFLKMAKRYSLSKAAVLNILQKLKIQEGDVLVVKDMETLHYLSKVQVPGIKGTIPLVYAPQGIQVLRREDLLNLLEQLEQTDKSVLEPYGLTEQPNAPL